jgi:hypothetical protein
VLNTLRQIGGSIGTALLAVVLQHEAATALSSRGSPAGGLLSPLPKSERVRLIGPLANAFDHTFLWALVLALLTILPATVLIHAERTRRRQETTTGPETAESAPTLPRARAA